MQHPYDDGQRWLHAAPRGVMGNYGLNQAQWGLVVGGEGAVMITPQEGQQLLSSSLKLSTEVGQLRRLNVACRKELADLRLKSTNLEVELASTKQQCAELRDLEAQLTQNNDTLTTGWQKEREMRTTLEGQVAQLQTQLQAFIPALTAPLTAGVPSTSSPAKVGPRFEVMVSDLLEGTDDKKRANGYALLKKVGKEPTLCAEILRRVNGNPNSQILGKGTFGTVTAEGSYAIKFAKKHMDRFQLTELVAHAWVGLHPNIVRVVAMDPTAAGVPLIMEKADMTLHDLAKDESVAASTILKVVKDAASGIKYMHHRLVVNMDLKGDNILVVGTADGTTRGMVADLGLAVGMGHMVRAGTGTRGGIPPEGVYEAVPAAASRDVFAFGPMLAAVLMRVCSRNLFLNEDNLSPADWSMLTGGGPVDQDKLARLVHANMVDESSLDSILVRERVASFVADPVGLCKLIKVCVQPKAEDRPSMETVIDRLDSLLQAQVRREAMGAKLAAKATGAGVGGAAAGGLGRMRGSVAASPPPLGGGANQHGAGLMQRKRRGGKRVLAPPPGFV